MIGEENYLDSLTALSPKKQLAFGLLVFERLRPSLITFSKDTGFDVSCFLQARDVAWDALQSLENGTFDGSLNEACLKNAPDTEAFSHKLTSYALNAVLAISDIMEFTMDNHTEHIVHVSTLATDSIYLYLTSLESSDVSSLQQDRKIAAHHLMQQELGQEAEDIKFLIGLPDQFDSETISALRARVSAQLPVLPPTLR
jgi:uncharacterized protein